MITSRKDLAEYLRADAAAHGVARWRWYYAGKRVTLHFQRILRYVEYLQNAGSRAVRVVLLPPLKAYFRILSIWLGFTIPPNTFGAGLCLNHWGTIVVSPAARIGRNCRVNVCVNIGLKDGKAPTIGDDVYIGPGAKLFGGITLGNGVSIGANAVVNRSFGDGAVLVGVPARDVSRRESLASGAAADCG